MTINHEAPGESDAVRYQPSLRDMLMLEMPSRLSISPDGDHLAVTVLQTNWRDNRYEAKCTVYDLRAGTTAPLVRSGSVSQIEWVGNDTLAVLKRDFDGDGAQVWLFEGLIGEGWPVTDHKGGVDWFKPFAGGIVFCASAPDRDERKDRKDRFGRITHFEQEPSASALYYLGFEEQRAFLDAVKAATEDEAKKIPEPVVELSKLFEAPLAIREVVPSPAGDAIYLTCWPREDLVYYRETLCYRLTLDAPAALAEHTKRARAKQASKPADGENAAGGSEDDEDVAYMGQLTKLATPRAATIVDISPDGRALLLSYQGRDQRMYTREDLWEIDVDAAAAAQDATAFLAQLRNLTAPLDRQFVSHAWTASGIYGIYVDGTVMRIATLVPDRAPCPLDLGGIYPSSQMHASDTGRLAFVGVSSQMPPEIYVADLAGTEAHHTWSIRCISHYGAPLESWDLGTLETIRWQSRDGTIIEGVLRKPADFDPQRRYPLVLVVHGGPTWFSSEYLLSGEDTRYYPAVQFVNKGVLVLKPNYRGSIGRGQAFMELNVDNLGVGDLWDIESGIEHLVAQGWVDPERVGCMGWSQGGYISAFAGLHSDMFRAVSVGAGISDWYTYHISNDIPDFTIDYLSGSPFRDRERYAKTAPISNLARAHTPMLIQHGSDDRRVPLSNALELYRGLKEMGVPVELFIFPGMSHPITRPRENHAVMHQNLAWFSHYLLDEELQLD